MGKVENSVQKEICKYLENNGYIFTRINTTGIYDRTKNKYRANHYQLKGMADILIFNNGNTYFVECKGIYNQSKEQREFEDIITAEGFTYILARSLEDLLEHGF